MANLYRHSYTFLIFSSLFLLFFVGLAAVVFMGGTQFSQLLLQAFNLFLQATHLLGQYPYLVFAGYLSAVLGTAAHLAFTIAVTITVVAHPAAVMPVTLAPAVVVMTAVSFVAAIHFHSTLLSCELSS